MSRIIEKFELQGSSNIKAEYFTAANKGSWPQNVLLIKYSGTYRSNAQGDHDERYMLAMQEAAIAYKRPSAVLFDLSELEYEGGGKLGMLLSRDIIYSDGYTPIFAIIVGSENKEVFLSECFYNKTDIFEDMEAAFDSMEEKLAARFSFFIKDTTD